MKITNVSEKEVFNNLQSPAHKFNISKQGQQFIIDALSNTIYKNPIGTIIREYVSNAHDANVEAGQTQPVIVTLGSDGNGKYLSVVDMGVGLSEERITKVFVNYGESTKRNTDKEIGGFGIGAKSAFSYSDTFFVNTVVDGFVYKYILMKTNHEPEMQLISKEENKENLPVGTEIKIFLKDNDTSRFRSEIYNQLRYFDEVFVTEEPAFNDYKIKEFNNFKFSTQAIQNDKFRKLHICLGKVSYPIDFSLLGVPAIDLPLALKFGIGELKVTLSREELQYDEKTKQNIKDKIVLFKEELKELYSKQKFSFVDFVEFRKQSELNPSIVIDESNSFKLTGGLIKSSPMKLKQLPFLDSNIFPKNPFFFLKCDSMISESGNFILNTDSYGNKNGQRDIDDSSVQKNSVFFSRNSKKDKVKNLYLRSIGIKNLIVEKKTSYSDYVSILHFRSANKAITENTNNFKRVKLYKSTLLTELNKTVISYDSVVVPKAFLDDVNFKKKRLADIKKAEKLANKNDKIAGEIEFYNVQSKSGRGYSRIRHTLSKINFTIVLGRKEETEKLNEIYSKYGRFNSKYKYYCVTNDKIYEDLLKLRNIIAIDNFDRNFKVESRLKKNFVNEFITEQELDLTLFPKLRKKIGNSGMSDYDYLFFKDTLKMNPANFISDADEFEIKRAKRLFKIMPCLNQIVNSIFGYSSDFDQTFDLSKNESDRVINFRKMLSKHGMFPGKAAYAPICKWEADFIKQNEIKVKYLQSLNK